MHQRLTLAIDQETILVHPTRRQSFAGKSDSTFYNIWHLVVIGYDEKQSIDIGGSKYILSMEMTNTMATWHYKRKAARQIGRQFYWWERQYHLRVVIGVDKVVDRGTRMMKVVDNKQDDKHKWIIRFHLWVVVGVDKVGVVGEPAGEEGGDHKGEHLDHLVGRFWLFWKI